MLQVWEYETATGVTVRGAMAGHSDFGGADISYRFHRLDDSGRVIETQNGGHLLDIVSGSRLKAANRIGAMPFGGAFERATA